MLFPAPSYEERDKNEGMGAPRPSQKSEGASGLVGLLVSLVVLGGLAALVLTALPGSGTKPNRRGSATSGPIAGVSVPQVPAQVSPAASKQACLADYSGLQEAVSEYQLQHGSVPTSVTQLAGYFRGTISTSGFSLTVDPGRPGRLQVQTPGHPASDGNGNCSYAGP